ncbi:MAG: hypothetical protein R2796_10550 [Chitinophagaceae bacterium]
MAIALAWGGLRETNVWRNKSDTTNLLFLNHVARQDIDSSNNNKYADYNLNKCD